MAMTAPVDMAKAVDTFLDALTDANRSKALMRFDNPDRTNWRYVPGDRKGVDFRDQSEAEAKANRALLVTLLGRDGFAKAQQIPLLEDILRGMENNPWRDDKRYWTAVFGEPGSDVWGLRYEGHHITLNYTLKGGEIVSSSPQFIGTNPHVVLSGEHKGLRVLAAEEDAAFALLASLDRDQRRFAIVPGAVPADILGAGKARASAADYALNRPEKPLEYSAMSEESRGHLIDIMRAVFAVQSPAERERRRDKIIEAGVDGITFTWIGSPEKGHPHYFRILGPTFVIEYDNVQNQANHVHLVYREFDGDFGGDPLAEHYASHAH